MKAIEVSGEIAGDAVWEGAVRLAGTVVVSGGSTLRISPGTRIGIARESRQHRSLERLAFGRMGPVTHPGRPSLVVLGALRAEGRPGSEIHFFPEGEWGGIVCAGYSKGSSLRHTCLEGLQEDLVTCVDFAELELSDVTLRQGGNGLRCGGFSVVSVRRSLVADQTFVGVLAHDDSRVLLEDCSLHGNSTGAAVLGTASLRMVRCHVQGHSECGINVLGSGQAEVMGGLFEDNHTAISLCAKGRAGISDNQLCHNKLGVHMSEQSRANIFNNAFSGNELQDIDLKDDADVYCRKFSPGIPDSRWWERGKGRILGRLWQLVGDETQAGG